MLTEFGLENFKAFGSYQQLHIAPLTLLYGPNSGGKTSCLQAMKALAQSFLRRGPGYPLVFDGPLTRLGGAPSALFRHNVGAPIRFFVSFQARESELERIGLPFFRGPDSRSKQMLRELSTLGLSPSELAALEQATRLSRADSLMSFRCTLTYDTQVGGAHPRYGLSELTLERSAADEAASSVTGRASEDSDFFRLVAGRALKADERPAGHTSEGESAGPDRGLLAIDDWQEDPDPERFIQDPSGTLPWRLHTRGAHLSSQPDDDWHFYPNAVLFSRFVNSMTALGPLRAFPRRVYDTPTGLHASVGAAGEHLAELLQFDSGLTERLNDALAMHRFDYKVRVEEVGPAGQGSELRVVLTDLRSGVDLLLTDAGFGVSQVLPVLAEGLLSGGQRGRTVLVEQPEIHLHPRQQAELADFFARTSGVLTPENIPLSTPVAWLIETHSELLIRRLQRRVREGVLHHDDVSVIYIQPTDSGSRVVPLRLDDDGEFVDQWPRGFFDEAFNEVFARRHGEG